MSVVDDELLETAVAGGGLDRKHWPDLLERLLPRLDKIVHEDFPIPTTEPQEPPPPPPPAAAAAPTSEDEENRAPKLPGETSSSQDSSSQTSQTTNKENAPPHAAPATQSSPSRPAAAPTSSESIRIPATQDTTSLSNGSLPPQLSSMLSSINTSLTTSFADAPPYTIQRLAELILRPRKHYRSLAPYLRALDRVVSVSSSADRFPLPSIAMPGSSNEIGLLNGVAGGGLGSDESLGGALLTPIPWLRHENGPPGEVRTESTEIVDGPNGAGSIETVSVSLHGVPSTSPPSQPQQQQQQQALQQQQQQQQNESLRGAGAVTQGELLRQEQEAGVVPVAQAVGRQTRSATAAAAASPEETEEAERKAEDEERPHARGPEMVGVEDMGPQDRETGNGPKQGFDVEAALGRTHKEEKEGLSTEQAKEVEEMGGVQMTGEKGKEPASDSSHTVLVDADGRTESEVESKADASGKNEGPDAVDSTTL